MSETKEREPNRLYVRCALAAILVIAAFLLHQGLALYLGLDLPAFITFFPAVMLAALLCGLWPGLLATALASVLVGWRIMPLGGRSAIANPSHIVALALFYGMGVFMSLVAEGYRRNQRRVGDYKREQAIRETEEKLRSSEEQFRALADAIPQLCWMANVDGWIFWYNQRWYQYTGTTPEQMEGWGWQSVHDLNALPQVMERWKASITTGEPFDMVFPLLGADGIFRPFLTRVMPVKDADGTVVRWFGTNTDISEMKLAEVSLRESEDRYRNLFNSLHEGFCIIEMIFDADGKPADYRFLKINPAFEAQTGLHQAEGKLMRDLAPAHEAHWFEMYGRIALTGEPAHFQNEAKALNRYYDVHAYRVGEPEKRQVAIVFTDISDQKQAEEERETTIEFLGLVNRSRGTQDLVYKATAFFQERSGCEAVGIRLREGDDYPYFEARGFSPGFVLAESKLCARDVSGEIVRDKLGNPILECMCGNVLCGRFDPSKSFFTTQGSFWSNSTTELLASTTDSDRQARTRNRCNGEGYESVALIPLHVGEERFGLLQLNDRRKGQFSAEVIALWERLAGYLAAALSKFRAEEALQNSERMYRAIGESINYGVWVCDPEGRNTYASESFLKLVGMTQQQCSTFGWSDILHPDDAERTVAAWKECVRTEGTWDIEHRVRGVDGQWHPILAKGVPVRDDQGQIKCWTGINLDISNYKQAEQALLRSEKLASAGRMAASIAHEINNPLAGVTNLLFLIQGMTDLPEDARRYLENADEEMKRIAHITRQSLGFYREGNAPALTSINEVLESAVDLLKSRIRTKQAVIEKQWDEDIKITAVAGELRQVFSNLVANSLDAINNKGTIKMRVSVGTDFKSGSRCVRVTVADNGKGIPPSSQQHLFEPFFTTKGTTGTGLGLWVSKQIIVKHGGTLRVRSTSSGAQTGTAFSIALPLEPAALVMSQSAGATPRCSIQ
jgi:PAS domain S-box-containing protein